MTLDDIFKKEDRADRIAELVSDVIAQGQESSCCGAKVYNPNDEWAICMGCKEYCDPIKVEEIKE